MTLRSRQTRPKTRKLVFKSIFAPSRHTNRNHQAKNPEIRYTHIHSHTCLITALRVHWEANRFDNGLPRFPTALLATAWLVRLTNADEIGLASVANMGERGTDWDSAVYSLKE